MRKVLMTADTVGGVWSHALDLACSLSRHGVEVHLASMGGMPSAEQRDEASVVGGLTLYPTSLRLEWMHEPWKDVARTRRWLVQLERRLQPDVVHLNGYAHADAPFTRPVLVAGHSCVVSWWNAVHRSDPPTTQWRTYRASVERGLAAADAIVTPTHWMGEELARRYDFDTPRRVVPNGITQQDASWPEKYPVLLAAGRLWDDAKNVASLVRLGDRLPWPVWLAGEGAAPGASRHVEVLGMLSRQQLRRRMTEASIFVHPARYEPFGLAPLEAAAAGCALVLGDIPSLREVWGDAAVYVPPENAAALEASIRLLADDPALRDDMAGAAQRRASRYQAWRMGDAYLQLYRHLLQPMRATRVQARE